ncbi:MAG: hypothetical protein ABH969_02155 [Pseudomonadota bacterium]
MKGRKTSKEISSFPLLSSQPMEIGYKINRMRQGHSFDPVVLLLEYDDIPLPG